MKIFDILCPIVLIIFIFSLIDFIVCVVQAIKQYNEEEEEK